MCVPAATTPSDGSAFGEWSRRELRLWDETAVGEGRKDAPVGKVVDLICRTAVYMS